MQNLYNSRMQQELVNTTTLVLKAKKMSYTKKHQKYTPNEIC